MMRIFFRGGKAFVYTGLMMILMGLMVFIFPRFFAYVFAGFVILFGVVFTGIGLIAKPLVPPGPGPGQREEEDGFSAYEEIDE